MWHHLSFIEMSHIVYCIHMSYKFVLHGSGVGIEDVVPRRMLPKEYGGSECTRQELIGKSFTLPVFTWRKVFLHSLYVFFFGF